MQKNAARDNKQRALVTKRREVNTYALLWRTSGYLFEEGRAKPQGSFYHFLASQVFTAFTLEAYLNHIGAKLFDAAWNDSERLAPIEKLRFIAKHLGIMARWGRRPWQTVRLVLDLRNALAHGKTVVLTEEQEVSLSTASSANIENLFLRTHWEKRGTEKYAATVRADIGEILNLLHDAAKVDTDPLFFIGIQVGGTRLLAE